MAKVFERKSEVVSVTNMQDGDVAEIVEWHHAGCIGAIIQRYDDAIILIGKPSSEAYVSILDWDEAVTECRVKILSPGTLIVL